MIRSGIGAAACCPGAFSGSALIESGDYDIFYRVLAAFVEPVADKRISNAILVAAKEAACCFGF